MATAYRLNADSLKRSLTNWTQSNANEPCMCYDKHKSINANINMYINDHLKMYKVNV